MADSQLEARVLGQLLLMQSMLGNLPTRNAVMSFVICGLGDLPGVGSVQVKDVPAANAEFLEQFPLNLGDQSHGWLELFLENPRLYRPYRDYVRNFAFFLAVILEERRQREELEQYRKNLEAQVRERAHLLQAVVHNSIDVIFIKDLQGRYLLANQALADFLDMKAIDVIGKTDRELMGDESGAYLEECDAMVFRTKQANQCEETFVLGGKERSFHVSKSPFYDAQGELAGLMGIARDVTERRRNEQEREDLIFAMSHDLRSPLVNVMGFAQELAADVKIFLNAKTPAQLEEARFNILDSLRFIQNSTERMERLQSGLLRFARLGHQEFHIQIVDARALVHSILQTLTHQLRNIKANVQVQIEHNCRADPFALEQVFGNLVDNAMKYNRPGFPLELQVFSSVRQGTVLYHFRDNGRGIPLEHRQRVFGIFHRLYPYDEVPGEGLGLTLVRGLLQRMGGKISIADDNNYEFGVEFVVTLPLAADE